MSQFHVTITVVADTAEAAIGLSEASGMRLQDILEQPFVTHLSTRTGDDREPPTTRDRIDALIEYLGESVALKALENDASIYDYELAAGDPDTADLEDPDAA